MLVEKQLGADLQTYKVQKEKLKFDWSESCVEGHQLFYLDGSLENFSGIAVFDEMDSLVAEGWMGFVHSGEFVLTFWEFLTTWEDGKEVLHKKEAGIPDHIWRQIPDSVKPLWVNLRMKVKPPPCATSSPPHSSS